MASWTVSSVLLMYLYSIALILAMLKFAQVKAIDLLQGAISGRVSLWIRWMVSLALIVAEASLTLAIVGEIFLYHRHGIHIAGTHGLAMVRYLMTGGDIRFILMAAQEDWTFVFVTITIWVLLVICQYCHWSLWYILQLKFRFGNDVELIRVAGGLHFCLGMTAVSMIYMNPTVPLFI